ncbi:Transglutaminase-like superfamily protein [Rubripirellula tenax]|uniref:Transglutaminase-like superfamily protein n=1 Tax=Rubripirellula tenax TaxID=2528015 RepID=A0A5C6FIR7_9BACT|nr:transglutaminase domain-containing protein [Rubripirellula tenax]TWU60830.1 Transglutaminase-like superfamily protein [Rubripirellula tenax]
MNTFNRFFDSDRRAWIRQATALTFGSVLVARASGQDIGEEGVATAASESLAETLSDAASDTRLVYDAPQIQNWKIGLVLETPVTCSNVLATFVVPMDWPEQTVTLLNQNIDRNVTGWKTRDLPGGARQVVLQMARVTAGSTVEITFELAVSRSRILPPDKTDDLLIPSRPSRELRNSMGNSPNIDTSNARIKMAARDLEKVEVENDWERVEKIYDFVRENVEYVEGPIRNASDALKDGKGDCEDMTSLFVAMCRNSGIPARMVWIPDHCYPEFYLETPPSDGQPSTGIWFPCQAAGTRQFGRMDEYRPVLQKGDRFKVPESSTQLRYVSEYFKCDRKGKGNPRPKFIRELIDV